MMKLIHIADLHLGQVLYQHYDRKREHDAFFAQLEELCRSERPDALLVSGDLFDIQQPSASVKEAFTGYFVSLCKACSDMKIVIIAGNHDSATRLQADSKIWRFANVHMVGIPPAVDLSSAEPGWEEEFIIRSAAGYIVAVPYVAGNRKETIQHLLDIVKAENVGNLPVVLMGHLAVTGSDTTGHNFEHGTLRTLPLEDMGSGYDYLALGHIHKPQTIGYPQDTMAKEVNYPSPVARYSGSALHVSCDEKYPHTISVVELDGHRGNVRISQQRIEELLHFYELPLDGGAYASADDAISDIARFVDGGKSGYIRIRMDYTAYLPADFNQRVYEILDGKEARVRYNPKIIWIGEPEHAEPQAEQMRFEIAELQQMTDPVEFIERTIDKYPALDIAEIRDVFEKVQRELALMAEDTKTKSRKN